MKMIKLGGKLYVDFKFVISNGATENGVLILGNGVIYIVSGFIVLILVCGICYEV